MAANSQALDIASPKLLALWMAVQLPVAVHATDLQDPATFTLWQKYYESFLAKVRNGSLITSFEDARRLEYPDSIFHFIFPISVLEHILGDDDLKAMCEISRILRPGGTALNEVPYAPRYYVDHLAEDVYERSFAGEPVFYQRHYDDQTLENRLVVPSSLEVERRVFFGERFPFEIFWLRIPAVVRVPFLWKEHLISGLNLKELTALDLKEQDEMKRRVKWMLFCSSKVGDSVSTFLLSLWRRETSDSCGA